MKRMMSYILDIYFTSSLMRRMPKAVMSLLLVGAVLVPALQYRETGSAPVGWERSFPLSPFNVMARDIGANACGSILAVSYEGRGAGVYVSISVNSGASFMPAVRVAEVRSQTPLHPQVAVAPSGAITVAWQAYMDDEATTRIFYSSSSDIGATWSGPKKLALGKDAEMLPRVYYDDRNALHLFYHGSVSDVITLYHAVSRNGEDFETTGSLMRITSSMRGAFFPSIHLTGPSFFVVWQGKEEDFSDEIFFMRSSDYGKSWSGKKQITDSPGNNAAPSIAVHGDTVYVAYQNNDDKNWAIKLLRGARGGGSWDTVPLPVSATAANCYSPAVGISGDDVIVVWYDTREGGTRIFSRKYSVRENSFAAEIEISEARYESKNPVAVSTGGRMIVFWEERSIIMAKQTDVYVAPPIVSSETNPEGVWSRLPYVTMNWKPQADESGIAGYAVIVNELPDFNPTVMNRKPNQTSERLTDLKDGITYFHIRAVDGAGNFSRTVHYKLQVAVNPLPAPAIVSQTHPQGKEGSSNSPVFTWDVEYPERVKGFVYSLSKGSIKMPETFTTQKTAQFPDLPEGEYFFSLAAVDKANQFSRIATYDFTVGKVDRVKDPDYYKRLAEEEKQLQKKRFIGTEGEKKASPVAVPFVFVSFPFDRRQPFEGDSFNAVIQVRNIPAGSIEGYAVYIGRQKRSLPFAVNHKEHVLRVKGLATGDYHIGVRCRYRVTEGGVTRSVWTMPYETTISILVPQERSPVVFYARHVLKKFPQRLGVMSLALLGIGLVITTMGFGSRLSFYLRLAGYRLAVMYRLVSRKEE